LQNLSQANGNNLKNVRRETREFFRGKKGISERKNGELETNSKNKISQTYMEA
jgi:hypothetical protein